MITEWLKETFQQPHHRLYYCVDGETVCGRS